MDIDEIKRILQPRSVSAPQIPGMSFAAPPRTIGKFQFGLETATNAAQNPGTGLTMEKFLAAKKILEDNQVPIYEDIYTRVTGAAINDMMSGKPPLDPNKWYEMKWDANLSKCTITEINLYE